MNTHPQKFACHEENRRKVCVVCGKKIVLGTKKINSFSITTVIEELIKRFVKNDFSTLDPRFPSSICISCRFALQERDQGNFTRQLVSVMPTFLNIILKKETRGTGPNLLCDCLLCATAKSNKHPRIVKGRPKKPDICPVINNSDTLHGFSHSIVTNEHKVNDLNYKNESVDFIKLCQKCLGKLEKGISHSCVPYMYKKPAQKSSNIVSLISDHLSQDQKERVAHSIIAEKQKKEPTNDNKEIVLKTAGLSSRLTLNMKRKSDVFFDADTLHRFQVHTTSTQKHMRKVTNLLRTHAGKNSVEKGVLKSLSEKSNRLDSCYKSDFLLFDIEKKKIKEKRPVIWADAETLVETVIEERNLIGGYTIKVMADGGQGFLKICFSILDDQLIEESSDSIDDSGIPAKRKLYSEGGSTTHLAKATSVKRLYMLCIVPEVKETYENFDLLFTLTNINKISFKFVSDFKVMLIVNGQQTATAKYPCPYCFITLDKMRYGHENAEDSLILKTFGDLRNDYKKFCLLTGKKSDAQQCHSTVNLPLFEEEDDKLVIEKCIVPELHILQGLVNHVFRHGLVPLVGEERAMIWPRKLNLTIKDYHGKVFEGNACRRLVREYEKLRDPDIYKDVGELAIIPYISVFRFMDNLVQCCFGEKISTEINFDKCIKDLEYALGGLPTTVTLKIHVLLLHVKQCLKNLQPGNALGLWSEQAGESVHREFKKHWERVKINSISNPRYAEQLRKTTVQLSSHHI